MRRGVGECMGCVGGRCREVGMSKERCVGSGEVWGGVRESAPVWGEWGSVGMRGRNVGRGIGEV